MVVTADDRRFVNEEIKLYQSDSRRYLTYRQAMLHGWHGSELFDLSQRDPLLPRWLAPRSKCACSCLKQSSTDIPSGQPPTMELSQTATKQPRAARYGWAGT
jgi:hypothetical protein